MLCRNQRNKPLEHTALNHLKAHLKGKVVILGIGNTLRSDDGVGSLLAGRIKDKVPYLVYDAGTSPENYLGKIIRDKPDNIVLIDAADFGGRAGELRVLEPQEVKTQNIFFTHNASVSLVTDYLQNNLKADIIVLFIQPQLTVFSDRISEAIKKVLEGLEKWFYHQAKEDKADDPAEEKTKR
ncbi:MAG: hydrogenase 3 maturation endopeptidase HyCI [Candidatus Omnitrophota bacterium]